jgi:hypothetical protein
MTGGDVSLLDEAGRRQGANLMAGSMPMTSRSQSSINLTEPMLQRICAEYLEMPGLQLTVKQAQRLWGLDEETCEHVLEFLLEARFLVRTRRNLYARPTDGSVAMPTLRIVKASLDRARAGHVDRACAS